MANSLASWPCNLTNTQKFPSFRSWYNFLPDKSFVTTVTTDTQVSKSAIKNGSDVDRENV